MKPVEIQVTYDFICPWCWIGHEHLKAALKKTALTTAPTIKYVPYELNPNMPKDGSNRKVYRSAKFGSWARSQAMDADVTVAGKRAGVEFNYDRVEMTPNTRLAHRMMFFAEGRGDARKTETLFEAVFFAYFSEGQDIGKADVLVALAAKAGFDAEEVRAFLASNAGEREVVAAELQAQVDGVRSVPTLRIAGTPISGAQPADVLAEVLRQAATVEAAASTV
ncbi:DsbA family oxidoreductase [Roseateles sp.]|uniref:DsbA family oxidoreductase n=1 Tax=Roseateles sp. TaxID=1971397 RepID=UPI0025CEF70A|nr:DsbA family oxidoreductase [Roseateles sp.]MBV8036387.1 DsbA family oxidoreductase [Roseateles sp.]